VVKRHLWWFPLLTFTLAVAVMAAAPLQAQGASERQLLRRVDPKAQQLLDRAIQALGGKAFLSSKTLTTKGRIYAIRDESTAGLAPFQSHIQYPDKRRFSYGKTPPVILINNGDKGWEIDRYGLIDLPKEQLQRWIASNRYSLENLLRERLNDPGILVLTSGVDFVDNVPTQGIEITEAGGTNVRLDLSRQTFLPIRISYQVRNLKTGDSDDYADVYADYKPFDGIQTPMHITRYVNGERVGETFRNSAHYNEDYPANYFTPE
jgi:Ni/Co efflux regulator RcnB